MIKCERCLKETTVTTMSYLNTEMICLECDLKEKDHPQYKEAKEAELAEVRKGNYNYKGLLG